MKKKHFTVKGVHPMSVRNLSIEELRDQMVCPISYALFQDPVTEKEGVCGGHTFERRYIDDWVNRNQNCPLSRTHLIGQDLIPNDEIRRACALLDEEREDPLSQRDMEVIYEGVEALLQRRSPNEAPERVPQEIHDDIFDRISKAMRDGTDCLEQVKAEKKDSTDCVIL